MLRRRDSNLTKRVLIGDVVLTLLVLASTSALRLMSPYGNTITRQQVQLPWQLYVIVATIWTLIFLLLGPHESLATDSLLRSIGRLTAAVALALMTCAGILYLSFRDMSRLQFLFFAALDLFVLLLWHVAVRYYLHDRSPHDRPHRTLIVGSGSAAEQLVQELADRPGAELEIVGCTTDQAFPHSVVPILGPIDATARIVAEERIEQVIFATAHEEEITRLSLQFWQQPVVLHRVPGVLDLAFARTPVEIHDGIHLISLRQSALTESQLLFKRLFDLFASGLLLILCSPLFLLIAVAIKLESRGPIFFLQERIGERGHPFTMIKFRTMRRDAEQRQIDRPQGQVRAQVVHKRDDDPRVTRVGRKLRRSSLDELPQLLNVLRGDMSLVGPRPELPDIVAHYAPWQWQRFSVPAGMTGWWQINGRSTKPMHLHTDDDLYYIQNYSFWLDLKILFKTIPAVLKGQGAF